MSELENLVNSAKSAESTDGGQSAAPASTTSQQQGGAFTQTAKTQTTGGGLSGLAPQMPKTPAPSFGGALAGQYRTLLNTAYDAARKRMKQGGDAAKPVNPFADTKGLFAAMMEKPAAAQNAQAANPQDGGMEVTQPSMSQGSTQTQVQAQIPQAQVQRPAQRPQVTVGRGILGGDARTYERNGATVEIPKSVGEDEKSVGAFMDMMDAVGDAMDRAYEEE